MVNGLETPALHQHHPNADVQKRRRNSPHRFGQDIEFIVNDIIVFLASLRL